MAMDDGKITITITDNRGSGSTGKKKSDSDDTLNENQWIDKAKDFMDHYEVHKTINFIKEETMKMINAYIGTIGERTGNYLAQSNVQVSLGLAGKGINMARAAFAGVKVGGLIGAAIGTGASIVLMTTNLVLDSINFNRQIRYANTETAMLRQRAGLDNLNNGSR